MMNKIFKKNDPEKVVNPLAKIFYDLESSEASPFNLALASYDAIKQDAGSSHDFFNFLIEDSMFTSLYATFYEQLLIGINQNPLFALKLIEKFSEQTEERERIIASQAQDHFNFIENYGMCDGCASCENHTDVASLISHYQKGDIDFFTELYLGMQTIQFTMESLVYDILPSDPTLASHLTHKNILNWRQIMYKYSQVRISEL
ncbi:hypothetical protein [Bacteriovorax sp. Seq25_V]|uniref:hypothetical protein n=1 Tax=Bacteriovorax sp. Seq25_V TaxID=1201288 RepID=UPI000389F701|nr:hypothetical protein [Bacteriovorax sp. Seq25_V]EQC43883.1 hypothetical protein M900_1331 [Bacteriovorax sp. Seq25_V]